MSVTAAIERFLAEDAKAKRLQREARSHMAEALQLERRARRVGGLDAVWYREERDKYARRARVALQNCRPRL